MPAEATRDEIAAEIHDMAALNIQERLAELRQAIPQLDLAEIEARNHLDDIIGRRARITALITDLDQLVTTHFNATHAWELPEQPPTTSCPAANDASATAPDPTPTPGGDRYERAAACARAAHAVGQPMNIALLEAGFAGTLASAQQFLTVLRKRGHDIPSGRTRNTPPDPASDATPTNTKRPKLASIAEVYKDAVANDRKPITAIVDRWDCTRQEANAWVTAARTAGHLPPRTEPVIPAGDVPHHFVPKG